MWIVFAILVVLLVLGLHFYVPFLVTLALLAAILTVAGIALMPREELGRRS